MGRTRGPEGKAALRHLGARRLSLRAVRLLIGAGLVLLSWPLATPLVDEYRAQEAYRSASACPAGEVRTASGADCLVPGTGTVTDKETEESCSTDSYGVEDCSTYRGLRADLRVHGDARTEWIHVGQDMYRHVERGDRAEVILWRDEVVRVTVGDRVERIDPGFGLDALRWESFGLLLGSWLAPGAALLVVFGRRRLFGCTTLGLLLITYLFTGLFAFLALDSALFGPGEWWRTPLLVVFAVLPAAFIVAVVKEVLEENA
ncbi:hypothetical protein [Streptomyces sp. V4I2]|uniref:hypothetical protein n=1 Tax=Streptomyces sp. V4I2 TaxID=3042280 RepID=UPI00277DC7B1|nr:hypothetical protein [Streptomyces sp. V4I2]MDQ1046394.1 hypothetical protein [Streptomyces sp. V4I2]